jgi:NAD-dependent deacetylase
MIDLIQRAAELIANSQRAVALTGAGISTPSGIPDFRTPATGLWAQIDPLEVATVAAFRHRPEEFFNWIRPLARHMRDAQPNAAHLALAQLEQSGKLINLITQNIDRLHHRAGMQQVIELHGNIEAATCVRCYRIYPAEIFGPALIDAGQLPTCSVCGGLLKPNVILFGEALPVHALLAAQRVALACDLMLIAGSSLEVAPASDLPLLAHRQQAKLIIINREPTHIDQFCDVVIHADVAEALPQIAAAYAARAV